MTILNRISNHPLFAETRLRIEFERQPLGFIDIGSAGGVHPLTRPIASLVNCLCFEPHPGELPQICAKKENEEFAGLTACGLAVAGKTGLMDLHITRSPVNTSMLVPNHDFVNRYGLTGFDIIDNIKVHTQSLDTIVDAASKEQKRTGEFIKLDCQGLEYEILTGASKTLENYCCAVWCEVEFCQVYDGQKMFSDIDELLRSKGFSLYGMYPHYISARKLDRRLQETNERLMWADTLYFKDPLSIDSHKTTRRDFAVLFLVALTTGYYDFACELAEELADESEKEELMRLSYRLAQEDQERLSDRGRAFVTAMDRDPESSFLFCKKFIDAHKGNNNIDFLSFSLPDSLI